MATTSLTAARTSYLQLVTAIKHEIAAGKKIIQQAQAETYWKVGKYISEYILEGKDRAGYGEETYQKLSKDLKISVNNLERMARFSREFTISDARQKLKWTHFRAALALPDKNSRRELIRKALKHNLKTREFQKEIAARKPFKIDLTGPIPQLKASPGTLRTYTVIEDEDGAKYLDCGFDCWHYLPSVKAAAGAVVDENFKTSSRTAKDLYTFKAKVQKVVDGDTLWVVVDLGFAHFTRQKLRLRGIDCPELEPSTKISKKALEKDQLVLRAEGEARTTALKYPGQAAKRFVQNVVKPKDFVLLKTHKDDKYGRYLVDLWYQPSAISKQQSAQDFAESLKLQADSWGYLNQELLNNRLAVKVSG